MAQSTQGFPINRGCNARLFNTIKRGALARLLNSKSQASFSRCDWSRSAEHSRAPGRRNAEGPTATVALRTGPHVFLRSHAAVHCCGSQTSQTRGPERDSVSRSNGRQHHALSIPQGIARQHASACDRQLPPFFLRVRQVPSCFWGYHWML